MDSTQPLTFEYRQPSDFPFLLCRNESRPHRHSQGNLIYFHWHREMEFLYVRQGRMLFDIQGQAVAAKAGEAVMLNREVLHGGRPQGRERCIVYAMVFEPSLLRFAATDECQTLYVDPFVHNRLRMPHHISGCRPWERRIIAALEDIAVVGAVPAPGRKLRIKLKLYEIFLELVLSGCCCAEPPSAASEAVGRWKQVTNFVEEHYQRRIYIEELADAAGFSTDHFYRRFRNVFRQTPLAFINRYRTSKAMERLWYTDTPIQTIALDVGFSNANYFTRVFKAVNGCTPRQYRRMAAGQSHSSRTDPHYSFYLH